MFMNERKAIFVPTCYAYRNREYLCRVLWREQAEAAGWKVHFYDEGETFTDKLSFNLTAKIKRMFRVAVEMEYNIIAKADTDTMVFAHRLHLLDLRAPYIGNFLPNNLLRYAQGGFYVVSRYAAKIITASPETETWAEDRFVGNALYKAGIALTIDRRLSYNSEWNERDYISWHGLGTKKGSDRGCPYVGSH